MDRLSKLQELRNFMSGWMDASIRGDIDLYDPRIKKLLHDKWDAIDASIEDKNLIIDCYNKVMYEHHTKRMHAKM